MFSSDCGFRCSPALSTLSEAVFPFYIVHQTAIVLAGHLLNPHGLSAPLEAGTILAIALASGLAAWPRQSRAAAAATGLKPISAPAKRRSPAAA